MKDTLWLGLTDSHAGCPMGITAENLAADYGITRAASDAYALGSQQKWKAAQAKGVFNDELFGLELPGKKKGTTVLAAPTPFTPPFTAHHNINTIDHLQRQTALVGPTTCSLRHRPHCYALRTIPHPPLKRTHPRSAALLCTKDPVPGRRAPSRDGA